MNEKGKLYLVATPIGNLQDMTGRAVEVLKSVDVIAAEDTRNSIKLLNHFEIHTPMTSYHEFNRFDKADVLVERMEKGESVACITDAGTPGISDPGEVLVQKAVEAGIEVTAVPGACACINALILSGLPTRRFRFEAFLPTEKKEKEELYKELSEDTATLIFYEAPHRLVKTLEELLTIFGDRKVSLVKELTKIHEQVYRDTLKGALSYYKINEPKGEFVIVLEGKNPEEKKKEAQSKWENRTIKEHMAFYENQGIEHKEAMKLVAKDRGVQKREIYQQLLEE